MKGCLLWARPCGGPCTEQMADLAGPLTLSRSEEVQLHVMKIREECTVRLKQSPIVRG